MFTGIVEEIGVVKGIIQGSNSIVLSIQSEKIMGDMKNGDSIAVNGICLTVTGFGTNYFIADVMPETMRKTNLETLKTNTKVNLERALRPSDRMGGHIVSGHIDGIGILEHCEKEDNAIWLTIRAPKPILKYIVMKGSICLDGTSLTVAYIDQSCFKVSLIPLTAELTTLGKRAVGDKINIECDVIAKYLEKLMYGEHKVENEKVGLSIDFLKENGFA